MCHMVGGTQYSGSIGENLLLELRRGLVVLAVLARLDDERYGYALKKDLAGAGLEIEEGTLYPLLRRLEDQGLLASRWRMEDGRRRRYYRLSAEGRRIRDGLAAEWNNLAHTMEGILP
jgi:PadR family transcriptional regulator PadR